MTSNRRSLVWILVAACLLALCKPAAAAVRVKDHPRTNTVTVGAATNYILIEVTALGTNSTQLISVGDFVSNTIPALLNIAGSTATNNAPTNASSFGVFDQIALGVFRYYNLEQGTNAILYRTPTSIVVNATAPAGSGGSSLGTNVAQTSTNNGVISILSGVRLTNTAGFGVSSNQAMVMRKIPAVAFDFPSTDWYDDLGNLVATEFGSSGLNAAGGLTNGYVITVNGDKVFLVNAITDFNGRSHYSSGSNFFGAIKLINGQVAATIPIIDGNTNLVSWLSTNVFSNLAAATNALHTRAGNLEGATNGLTTRATNLEGATNGITTRLNNLDGSTNAIDALVRTKQHGSAALTNLAGTVARNVTNVVSLSTSNATSKPLTNSYSAGVLTLYGLEAGANTTITPNGTNLVIASTGGGGTLSFQSNAIPVATENTANFTNNTEFLWVMSDVPASTRVDIEARLQNNGTMLGKLQTISAGAIVGHRTGSGIGNMEELQTDTTLEVTSGAILRRTALTGDITAAAGSGATTIANNAVTDAKFRQSSATSIPGRSANSAGNVADIQATFNGAIYHRSNNAVIAGKVVLTNDYFANLNLLSVADGDVATYHAASGMWTNRPASSPGSSNYTTLASGSITAGRVKVTNDLTFVFSSLGLIGTNLWATGAVSTVYTQSFNGIGVSNVLVEIENGQTIRMKLTAGVGCLVGFPQFPAAKWTGGAVLPVSTNLGTTPTEVFITRTGSETNITMITDGYTIVTGSNIVATTNHATQQITYGVIYAPIFTNASLYGLTPIDAVTNLNAIKFKIQQPAITASNLVVSFATNNYECVGLTNIVLTNIVEETTGVNGSVKINIRNTLSVSVPIVWPAFGAQHGYYFHTNGLNDVLTATVAPPGTNTIVSLEADGTNLYPTVTYWRHP